MSPLIMMGEERKREKGKRGSVVPGPIKVGYRQRKDVANFDYLNA